MDNIHLDCRGEVLKDIAFFILQEKANSTIFKEVTKIFLNSTILDTLLTALHHNKELFVKLMEIYSMFSLNLQSNSFFLHLI